MNGCIYKGFGPMESSVWNLTLVCGATLVLSGDYIVWTIQGIHVFK